jgi:hypothetical protein
MIPYDIDPSLYTGEPEPPSFDDGFSPPPHEPKPEAADAQAADVQAAEQIDPALWTKSQF